MARIKTTSRAACSFTAHYRGTRRQARYSCFPHDARRNLSCQVAGIAHALFAALEAEVPESTLYTLYLQRAATYAADPPPADWDGATLFTS